MKRLRGRQPQSFAAVQEVWFCSHEVLMVAHLRHPPHWHLRLEEEGRAGGEG